MGMSSRGIVEPARTYDFSTIKLNQNQAAEEWDAEFDREYKAEQEANLREQHPIGKQFTVYRLYDHDWAIAYVGITRDFNQRLASHMSDKWWFVDIDMSVIITDHFATADAASLFEKKLIADLDPLYNVAGSDRAYSKYRERA